MFDPNWKKGCPGCTGLIDEFGNLKMLAERDTQQLRAEVHSASSSTASTPNQTLADAGSLPTDVNWRACLPALRSTMPRSIEPDGQMRPQ
jgi:Bacterial protein of unknown function (DUF899)